MAELDALDPIPDEVELNSGFTIELERLKARQFFKLLRIVTNGALPQLANAGLFDMDGQSPEDFQAQFVTVMLMSIPEAEQQTIDFIRSMARPSGLRDGRKLNKQDEEHNIALWLRLDEELDNPELDDLVTIIEAIVKREASDIQALGKRLASMFKLAQKTGQVPDALPSQKVSTAASSEDSAAPSTSSPRSTRGRTTSSPTSPSRASGSASRRSKSAVSTAAGSESSG